MTPDRSSLIAEADRCGEYPQGFSWDDKLDLIRRLSEALRAADEGWRPIESAPTEQTVLVWGAGGLRFMRKDNIGQWRNMMHAPKRAPKFWRPLPLSPSAEGGE